MSLESELDSARPLARIYLVRHGETQANRDGIIQGHRDTTLNARGEEQARMLGIAFKNMRIGRFMSSDLQRASKTAEAILEHHPDVKLVKQRELRERHLGNLEGTRSAQGLKKDETAEKSSAFKQRGMDWWKKDILGRLPDANEAGQEPLNVVATSHGGFIKTLVRNLLESRGAVCDEGVVVKGCSNASISVIEVTRDGKGVVRAYGDIAHLAQKQGDAPLNSIADDV